MTPRSLLEAFAWPTHRRGFFAGPNVNADLGRRLDRGIQPERPTVPGEAFGLERLARQREPNDRRLDLA